MVVGDDDQSIYSWRGADIRNILEFEHDYPEAAVVKLEENYRSSARILMAANAVVANNPNRKPKTLFTSNAEGEMISSYLAADERDEARFIAGEVERLQRAEGRRYTDCAVFYRTNAQSRSLEDAFMRAGVPYKIVGGTRFFDRAEIRDVMAYLKVVVNPADEVSLKRVINTPRSAASATPRSTRSSSRRASAAWASRPHCVTRSPRIGSPARTRGTLHAFAELLDELRSIARATCATSSR